IQLHVRKPFAEAVRKFKSRFDDHPAGAVDKAPKAAGPDRAKAFAKAFHHFVFRLEEEVPFAVDESVLSIERHAPSLFFKASCEAVTWLDDEATFSIDESPQFALADGRHTAIEVSRLIELRLDNDLR